MALLARDALVSIAQRRAAALNYRLQGHNYAAIGKHLGVAANAVQKDVVKALRDFIKPETAHAVLAMELTRLDAMQAAVYAEAINGDTKRDRHLLEDHETAPAAVELGPRSQAARRLCNHLQLLRKKPVLGTGRWSGKTLPETSCRSLGNLLKHGRSQPR